MTDFEYKLSPKPVELPIQTALIKDMQPYNYEQEHNTEQLTQQSEYSFMDK